MHILLYCMASVVLVILFLLHVAGVRLIRMQKQELNDLNNASVSWPKVALIIPVAGSDPRIPDALGSLLTQDYPALYPILVTETASEPAAHTINALKARYPKIIHIVAGHAGLCGQKNHNLLAGVRAAKAISPDCYVFCDSTHRARPDFLKYMVAPIAAGKAVFTTGYHQIVPKDTTLISQAYAASVLFMRLLQAVSVFTQPWGGAMAIERKAFEQLEIAETWSKTVVDDCALVPLLAQKKCRVQLVANALLTTHVENHDKAVWEAWMERQILFPRFCVPIQWWLLGLMLIFFFIPPIIWIEDIGITVSRGDYTLLLAPILWCALLGALVAGLRRFLVSPPTITLWFKAFFRALLTFGQVYTGTIGAHTIRWHGKEYRVGRGGIVTEKHTKPQG
ncbi:MAG: glycosyltransferase family 2 protein [Desulfovibrionaceae bacterium]|nr:glycosyltransferase family 2 protein [Desulfovibrionaceae bacterium]